MLVVQLLHNAELKPCPFCGTTPRALLGGMYRCDGTETHPHCGIILTPKEWNTRATDALVDDLVVALNAARRFVSSISVPYSMPGQELKRCDMVRQIDDTIARVKAARS